MNNQKEIIISLLYADTVPGPCAEDAQERGLINNAFIKMFVITSYSIHYTKLYDQSEEFRQVETLIQNLHETVDRLEENTSSPSTAE